MDVFNESLHSLCCVGVCGSVSFNIVAAVDVIMLFLIVTTVSALIALLATLIFAAGRISLLLRHSSIILVARSSPFLQLLIRLSAFLSLLTALLQCRWTTHNSSKEGDQYKNDLGPVLVSINLHTIAVAIESNNQLVVVDGRLWILSMV